MGNLDSSQRNSELYSVLKPLKWQKQAWLGQSQLVRDPQTGLRGQSYSLNIDNISQQLRVYQFRKDNPQYIVTVHSVEETSQQILCTGNERIRVITERIPFRLTDLGNVGYAEGLYILQCALKGANLIDSRYLLSFKNSEQNGKSRYIHYSDEMICFTQKGETKIWVNEHIALNTPQFREFRDGNSYFDNYSKSKVTNNNILDTLNIEKRQVKQLMGLIQSKMSGNKFQNYLEVKRTEEEDLINFQNCIDFILRMRAIEEGQSQAVRNIILPSMVLQSMGASQYTNRDENTNMFAPKSNRAEQFSDKYQRNPQNYGFVRQQHYNVITQRLNKSRDFSPEIISYNNSNTNPLAILINNNLPKSQNEILSNSSINSDTMRDVSKYAVPPRPPRKSSRSGSRQRPSSRNGSQEKPIAKPNLNGANMARKASNNPEIIGNNFTSINAQRTEPMSPKNKSNMNSNSNPINLQGSPQVHNIIVAPSQISHEYSFPQPGSPKSNINTVISPSLDPKVFSNNFPYQTFPIHSNANIISNKPPTPVLNTQESPNIQQNYMGIPVVNVQIKRKPKDKQQNISSIQQSPNSIEKKSELDSLKPHDKFEQINKDSIVIDRYKNNSFETPENNLQQRIQQVQTQASPALQKYNSSKQSKSNDKKQIEPNLSYQPTNQDKTPTNFPINSPKIQRKQSYSNATNINRPIITFNTNLPNGINTNMKKANSYTQNKNIQKSIKQYDHIITFPSRTNQLLSTFPQNNQINNDRQDQNVNKPMTPAFPNNNKPTVAELHQQYIQKYNINTNNINNNLYKQIPVTQNKVNPYKVNFIFTHNPINTNNNSNNRQNIVNKSIEKLNKNDSQAEKKISYNISSIPPSNLIDNKLQQTFKPATPNNYNSNNNTNYTSNYSNSYGTNYNPNYMTNYTHNNTTNNNSNQAKLSNEQNSNKNTIKSPIDKQSVKSDIEQRIYDVLNRQLLADKYMNNINTYNMNSNGSNTNNIQNNYVNNNILHLNNANNNSNMPNNQPNYRPSNNINVLNNQIYSSNVSNNTNSTFINNLKSMNVNNASYNNNNNNSNCNNYLLEGSYADSQFEQSIEQI